MFRSGVEWAQDGRFTQQDVDEAKLSMFSAVDAPVAPSDKGQLFHKAIFSVSNFKIIKFMLFKIIKMSLSWVVGLGLFLNGITDQMKQAHRERLFAVTHNSLIDVANR